MHKVDDSANSIGEYHARQLANSAGNDAAGARHALSSARIGVRSVRKHLEKALEFFGESGDSEIRHEIEAAIAELDKMIV
jgi:hypothetical protein